MIKKKPTTKPPGLTQAERKTLSQILAKARAAKVWKNLPPLPAKDPTKKAKRR